MIECHLNDAQVICRMFASEQDVFYVGACPFVYAWQYLLLFVETFKVVFLLNILRIARDD